MFSGVLRDVLAALLTHLSSYVQFPRRQDLANVKADFYALGGIPHVMGAIDGTHVALVPPHDREQVYRKHFHSINVQVVCLADHYISHVFAGYPGSAHDSFVLRNSSITQMMAQLHRDRAWLVGEYVLSGVTILEA